MAVLTWQQVAGPSFSGSNDLLRTGALLQQNALSGLSDSLAQFRKEQTTNLDNEVMARALRVNDPAAFQKGLTDGSFLGSTPLNQLSPQTLQALGARAGALVKQANTQSIQADRDYNSNRTRLEDQIQDAARPQTATRLGLTGPLAQLAPKDQLALRQGEVSLAGGILGNENRQFLNTTQQRDDGVQQVGINIADGILRRSASREDALAELEQMTDAQPAEREYARAALEKTFGSLYNPGGAATSGPGRAAGTGKPGTQTGSPYDTTFNFQGTDRPISSTPISGVLDVQEKSKSTQGHSPMGAFQINKATLEDFGPRVLGKDWQAQEFSPENQEKIAKAIFDERKGGDLTKTWAALPNSNPGAYKDYSWEQMRSIIGQGEVGQNLPSDPASLRLLSQASQFEANRRAAQNDSVGVTADVAANLNEHRSAPELVQEAVKTSFPGADVGRLTGIVNKAQRDNPGLSAADVLSAVKRSTRDAATYNPLARGWAGTTEFAPGVGIDDEAFEANLKSIKDGKADYLSNSNQLTRKQASDVATAQGNYDTALQNLMAISARQNIQPGVSTERQQAAFDKAEAALKKALAKQHGNPNYRPVRQ